METQTKSSVIFAADLHLLKKPGLWSRREEIADDDLFALRQIADLVVEHDADLILGGDILDASSNYPRPIKALKGALENLQDRFVGFVQGQHDMVFRQEETPWLSLIGDLRHLHGKSFNFLGLPAFALDFFPQASAEEALELVPKTAKVLILHGLLDQAMPINYHFKADSIPGNVQYVFAGDLHELKKVDALNFSCWYPGSTYLNAVNEPFEKFILKVEKASLPGLSVTALPLKTRPVFKTSELEKDQGAGERLLKKAFDDALENGFPETVAKPLVIDDVGLEDAAGKSWSRHGHVYSARRSQSAEQPVEIFDGLISDEEILKTYCSPEKDPDVFQFALDVVQNPVADSLLRLKKRLDLVDEDFAQCRR